MDINFKGRKALVTGSSKGIGFEIANYLQKSGCLVALNGRNKSNLEYATARIPNSIGIPGDVRNEVEAMKIIQNSILKLGDLDYIICNVGSGKSSAPGDEKSQDWRDMMAINFYSVTNIVDALLQVFRGKNKKLSIVCISSICGIEIIPGAPIPYSVAKTALNAYVKGVSRPLANRGIRINAIAPGNIYFEGSTWSEKIKKNPELISNMIKREVPLNRFGHTIDIAYLVGYLLSEISDFVTGAVWTIDGGQTRCI